MSRLTALLAALLLLGAVLPAQQGNSDPEAGDAGQGQVQNPDDQQERMEREEDRARAGIPAPTVPVIPSNVPMHFGLTVNVHQDPSRIAPGETGRVILQVVLPRTQAGARPAGKVEWATGMPGGEQLAFGQPVFDPPKQGRGTYDDNFLILVPVTVKPNTEYGTIDVAGKLTVLGDFAQAGDSGQDFEIAGADGAVEAGGAPPPPVAGARRNEAVIPFRGRLTIGPKVPQPGVQGGARGPAPRAGGTTASAGPEGAAAPANGAAGPDPARPTVLGQGEAKNAEAAPAGPKSPDLGSSSGLAPQGADFDLILKVGGVLIALVLLILILRGRGGAR